MSNEVVTKNISPAVAQAVARLYDVFGGYRAPSLVLDVCLNCCMDEALEKEMRSLPLRQISARHFYEYNTSATNVPQPADEIRYLLPRMLELIAEGAEIGISPETQMRRIGNCEAGAFSTQQYEAIETFARTCFAERLRQHRWQSENHCWLDAAFESLLMFHIGGVDMPPLLDDWLKDESVTATFHYIGCGIYDFWENGRVENAFAEDRPLFRETLRQWMTDDSHRRTFARRILDLDMSRVDNTPDCKYKGVWVSPQEMAQTVFEQITY